MTPVGPTPPEKRDAPDDGDQPSSGRGVPADGQQATPEGDAPSSGEQASSGTGTAPDAGADATTGTGRAQRPQRKSVLLRLDPAVHDALARWAGDDLRSVNAQIEMLLRRALDDAGRLPRDVRPPRRPGRPPRP
ncbi:AT hook motif protein [Cellulosimicrobium sp. TH-20]|uniref:AT hook motif protein n=1 Tax=Cellulosimicrobium sp. TH-20 TaxID=1980001 RepID=UPI0011A549C9|nr:AT hook motif protein [Cellulosimicrobium sp. TH-20]